MSNMSYCRFQNTSGDLADCQSALEDLFNGDTALSGEELRAARRLVETCGNILQLFVDSDVINLEDGDLCDVDINGRIEEKLNELNTAAEEAGSEEG